MSLKEKYKSASAYRMAIQEKLKNISRNENIDILRLYRQVAYTHFLARLFQNNQVPWVLKGGHALELRLQRSRATKDVDLALKEASFFEGSDRLTLLKEELIKNARLQLDDYFEFQISGPKMELLNAPYGGARFGVVALIDGKKFSSFDLDIGIGDVWIEPHDNLDLKNHLEFTGFHPPLIKTVSVEQHFSEKIHAYTLPRNGHFNSRVKDLVDLYLLIEQDEMDKGELKSALEKTFERRSTHDLPKKLSPPPKEWSGPWEGFNSGVDIEQAFRQVENYYSDLF